SKLNHPFEPLRPRPCVVRPVVQVDHQPPNAFTLRPHREPPHFQSIRPEIAGFLRAEDQRQGTARQDQNAQRRPLPLRRWVMIPCLGGFTFRVGSGFFPPESNHPRLPSPWCPWIPPSL